MTNLADLTVRLLIVVAVVGPLIVAPEASNVTSLLMSGNALVLQL